jgi:hypothetical protein
VAFLVAGVFSLSANHPSYLTMATIFILGMIQIKRPDKIFLKTHFRHYRLFYLMDCLLITAIIFFCLLWHFQWVDAVILLLCCLAVCFLEVDFTGKTRNTKIQDRIPNVCFEWKAGIRKMFLPIMILWISGIAGSFLIAVVPVVVFFLGILMLEFYGETEPYQFIMAYELGIKRFLWQKIKMQTLLFSTMILPLIFMFLIFHYQYWYIIGIEYVVVISLHIYIILLKYALYVPNGRISGAFSMIGLLFGLIVPIFISVIWGLSIYFYFKAKQRLNIYLNDYD